MAYSHPAYHGGLNYAEQITDEFLTCRICKKPGFRKPKVLRCGHTFCKPCIEAQLGVPSGTPCCGVRHKCFICGLENNLPRSGIDGLPDNAMVNIQIDRLLVRHNQDRGRENARYNIHQYMLNHDTMCATLPLPGETRNRGLE